MIIYVYVYLYHLYDLHILYFVDCDGHIGPGTLQKPKGFAITDESPPGGGSHHPYITNREKGF